MLVTLKTLQQQTFKIDIDPDETVRALKEKIESEKGKDAFPVAGQKLIYAGKILNDDTALKEYKIVEKNFVVVMVRALKEKIESEKGKDAFPVAGQKLIYAGKILNDDTALKEYKIDEKNFVVVMVTKPKAVTTPAPATTQQSNSAATTTVSSSTAPAVTQAPAPAPASAPTPTPVSVTPAPTTASSEPAPASAAKQEKPAERPVETPVATTPTSTDSTSGDSSRSNLFEDATSALGHPLEFLRNQPQFQQMRQIIQQNPSLLPALLQQIGRENPQLLQLKALGFPEGLVIQAYFACEKNENLAANFLLQQNFDED
ncbi:hypothetical protein E5288_WYG006714 [Bos mutus]|uniref:UV excision repair protein RAD23 n=1 Tax=Bos mutus TaxID=72004 RepID=A0A6B0RE20_9CETA|nr:hypothetical protein [Bos mutus]